MPRPKTPVAAGSKFGALTYHGEAASEPGPWGTSYRRCVMQCDCGKTCIVRFNNLRQGNTRSCGECPFSASAKYRQRGFHGRILPGAA